MRIQEYVELVNELLGHCDIIVDYFEERDIPITKLKNTVNKLKTEEPFYVDEFIEDVCIERLNTRYQLREDKRRLIKENALLQNKIDKLEKKIDIDIFGAKMEDETISLVTDQFFDFIVEPLQEELVEYGELREAITKTLNTLIPREANILSLYFGLGYESSHTLEEIGEIHYLSKERVRQIIAKALRKMRHPYRSKRLAAYLGSFDSIYATVNYNTKKRRK